MIKQRSSNFSNLALYFALLNLAGEIGVGAKVYNRYDFPSDFIFGSATSAYQVEGAAFEDGRKASIFDTFAHSGFVPGNGDVASDHYHKYKEDVQLMVETGLDAHRFSISWSRLIPNGRGHVNPKGLQFCNNLINELIRHGIQPHVTLVHFDIPQILEDEYGGFMNRRIIEDFTSYADVCFREFGDRVRQWTTISEPNILMMAGYDLGTLPPGRCSFPFRFNCTKGNSTTEPYIAAHNLLLAHASIARLYKEKYQAKQHGFLGFNLYAFHHIPFGNTREDRIAARRSYDFFIGWFMSPLVKGDYPEVMKRNVGTRLPVFTKNESELVKGSFDFVGLNYYTVLMAKDNSKGLTTRPSDYVADSKAVSINLNNTDLLKGDPLPVTPWGLQGVLEHFKQVYDNPPIFIHENGQITDYDTSVNDPSRVEYLQAHIGSLLDAVRSGSNTKGYFVWSFLDLFELMFGYKHSYGLYFVDVNDSNLTRYPKLSQKWYSAFLRGKNVTAEGNISLAVLANDTTVILQISSLDVNDQNMIGYPKLQ